MAGVNPVKAHYRAAGRAGLALFGVRWSRKIALQRQKRLGAGEPQGESPKNQGSQNRITKPRAACAAPRRRVRAPGDFPPRRELCKPKASRRGAARRISVEPGLEKLHYKAAGGLLRSLQPLSCSRGFSAAPGAFQAKSASAGASRRISEEPILAKQHYNAAGSL